jgi:hypothetical protein
MFYQYSWNMCHFINDNTWFMHDGAPSHFLHIVRHYLNQTFGEHRIGSGGPVNWPAQSPNLNPLDFWLWGHLKTLVYSGAINDPEVLHQWVEHACQEIRVKPGIFNRVCTSVRRKAESCVEMHGNHMAHLLLKSHEHRPYLSRHWFLDVCWLGLFWLFKWALYLLKACNPFLTPCTVDLALSWLYTGHNIVNNT